MGGRPQNYDFLGAFDTARASEQTFQKNAMEAQRARATQAALDAYYGDGQPIPPSGAIEGAPPPPVGGNAMGAPPAPAPGPGNAMRPNWRSLARHAGDPRAAAELRIGQADEAAAAAAARADAGDKWLGLRETRANTDFAMGYFGQSASRLANDASPEAKTRELAWLRTIPGIDLSIIDNLEAQVADMPPAELMRYARSFGLQNTGSARATTDRDADWRGYSTGSEIGLEDRNALSPTFGGIRSVRPATLSPSGEAAGARYDQSAAREEARELARVQRQYERDVAEHDRWVAGAGTERERAVRGAVPRPPPPGGYTPAQARELPSGTKFTGTDGRQYEVP